MESGLIPYQHHMYIGRHFSGKLFKKYVHHISVDVWRQQADALSCLRADRTDNIEPVIASLPDGTRTRPLACPYPGQCSLLAKTSLIFEPNFDVFVGMSLCNGIQCFFEVF